MSERLFDLAPIAGLGDEWYTPEGLKKFFHLWDDPCLPGRDDGLERDWYDPCYVNPPYSDPLPWVQKAIHEARQGTRIVMLLRHDSSTRWWQLLHESGAFFFACIGRLHYGDTGKPANFPSVLVFIPASLPRQDDPR
jgi:hypothetical protein